MPILKPISGHGSTGGIRRYLEKGGRALARDLFNLSYDERDAGALGNEAKEACAWDAEMDATRAAFGTDAPWRGKPARTFKHFVLSPDPGDDIDLAALRELACSWALKHFGDHEIAIVYHDDNARGIPHAHIVVNNANLRTGYRMQTQHPEDLNRDLQDMARERGLSGLSNDRAPESPSKARGRAGAGGPRSRRSVYLGRAEKEIMRSGGYSWVGDIRARVALAKTTARDEAEFLGVLDALGVHVADNSAKARRDDWVFSLAEEPSKKVSGERLGFVYGKEMLRRRFERGGAYRPTDASAARIREAAERALELNDLSELSRLSSALETCAKFDVESIEEFGLRMATLERRGQAGGEGYRRLEAARVYMAMNELMPLKTIAGAVLPKEARATGAARTSNSASSPSNASGPSRSIAGKGAGDDGEDRVRGRQDDAVRHALVHGGLAVLRREHAHGVRARDARGAREGALAHGELAPGARRLARRGARGRHPGRAEVPRVALHAGLGGRARARPPRPARRRRGVRPGARVPVRRGCNFRLLPRARGPSLKTAEVADKGPSARAGEGGGPGRAG